MAESKSPPPSLAVTNPIRKQRSRILGTPSIQESEDKADRNDTIQSPCAQSENADGESIDLSAVDPPQIELEPTSSASETRKESVWSLWSRRASLNPKPPSSPMESTPQQPSTAASIKSSKSNKSLLSQNEDPIPNGNDQTSEESIDKKEPPASWIGWRKPSVTSLKKAIDEDALNTTDKLKSVVTDTSDLDQNQMGIPNKKDRAGSWSLWNNSNTTQKEIPSLSNILLSGNGEAILFEATDHETDPAKKPKQENRIPNRVLPGFEKSLPAFSTATSLINNINRLRYTLGFDVEDPKHLYRRQSRPTGIKKVLIIGVHGFFPTKVLRPLIGEPTGTSIKFANEAEKAIWRWAKREKLDVSVQKLALEKEGKIFERVEFFYEVIKKWKQDVDSADYIYFAAHSQGCPVSILLLSRLIEDGIISLEGKRISLLCMAGINNGPFYGADQRLLMRAYSTIESDSLMELFQFQNFDSVHSRGFLHALRTVISHNVKITFVGSINDQLVPLYSSTCLHVRHPNIFRSTYIDGSSNTPEFISRAVGMANQLHNVGYSDHGVIKEISNSLAGPLTGGGHSRIYNDPQVYDLAISFSLYTSDLKYQIPLHFKPYVIEQLGTNPYHLPWCMRGLLFEARAHIKDANSDIEQLFEEFENWKPETKQLKDMKYRLNGIKSKL